MVHDWNEICVITAYLRVFVSIYQNDALLFAQVWDFSVLFEEGGNLERGYHPITVILLK